MEHAYFLGTCVLTPGEPCGEGLSTTSAHQLGLVPGTVVATSIIDAHAGGLGNPKYIMY